MGEAKMLEFLRSMLHRRARRLTANSTAVLMCVDGLELRQLLSAVTVEFAASSDTSIYQQDVEASNGAGQFIVAGGNARGLIKFDVSIPDGSTIIDAVLTLSAGATAGAGSAVSVHRLTTSWGEGASDASGDEYQGSAAQPFDATWQYSFFDGEQWDSPGGDFAGSSAATSVDGVGTYEWIGNGLIDDVQSWVDDAATNSGWLLQRSGNAIAFLSKDSPGGLGPSLEVTYEPPPGPPAIVEGRLWNDINGDGRRSDPLLTQLNLSPVGGTTYYNVFGGEEHWFRSGANGSWYFLTADGKLTRWDGTGKTLSGTSVGTIDNIYYLQPSLVSNNGGDAEPWLNGWTVELIDAFGNVAQTATTGLRSGMVSDGGWYSFTVSSDESYTVRQVIPQGWAESVRIEIKGDNQNEEGVNQLDLYFAGSYYENWGDKNERWMKDDRDGWHYITPDGLLYRWDGKAVSAAAPLNGSLIVDVGTAYYANPTSGPINPGGSTEQNELTRVDFGNSQSQTVSGRVWLDFFENALIDTVDVIPNQYELYPLDPLPAGEEWFYDYQNDDWYIINVDGQPRFHAHDEDLDDDFTRLPPGSAVQRTFVETVVEPWLNGREIKLIDQSGNVVATTTSRSIDLNNDGQIQYESERGWYVFENVPVGDYTILMDSNASTSQGWYQTAPVTQSQATAIALNAQLGFTETASDFLNWGGLNERWLRDRDNTWHYIVTDGSLYRWEVGTRLSNGGLRGTLVASLSSATYADMQLLFNPNTAAQAVHVDQDGTSEDLLFGSRRLLSDLMSEAGM
jgi:hypothetical protein